MWEQGERTITRLVEELALSQTEQERTGAVGGAELSWVSEAREEV